MNRRLTSAARRASNRIDTTQEAVNEVQVHMARVDTKASILFGFSIAILTGSVALLTKTRLTDIGIVFALVALFLIGVAAVLLGTAIRPVLGGNHGFVLYAASKSAVQLAARLDEIGASPSGYRTEQLLWLSRAVQRKYRRVRLAVDLIIAGLAFGALTAFSVAFL